MKKLSTQDREQLLARIEEQRSYQHRKELGIAKLKHEQRTTRRLVLKNWLPTATFRPHGYSRQLRQAKREKAMRHIFDRAEPLQRMSLSNEQKEALKRYLK